MNTVKSRLYAALSKLEEGLKEEYFNGQSEKEELQISGKEIYDSIIIPPELSDIVKKTIESRDKESIDRQYKESHSLISEIMKYIGAAAAVIIVSIIIGLNSNESFAKEMGEVPFLGAVAKVLTVRNYTVKRDELTINTDIPNVELTTTAQTPEDKVPAISVSQNDQPDTDIETNDNMIQNTVSENTVSNNGDSSENQNSTETGSDMRMTISGNDIISVTGEEKRL